MEGSTIEAEVITVEGHPTPDYSDIECVVIDWAAVHIAPLPQDR